MGILALTIPPLFGVGHFDFSSSYGICVPCWEGEPDIHTNSIQHLIVSLHS